MWPRPSLAVVEHHEASLDGAFGILVSLDLLASTAAMPVNWFTMPAVSITKPRAIGYLLHFEIAMAGFGTGESGVIELYLC
jgi:hypothetical protein